MAEVAGAGRVRDEDAFDVAAVAQWLSEQVGPTEITEVRQFSGGASNLTYLLRTADEGRDLILRRPPAGTKAKSAHDMSREYRIQKALKPVFGLVPEMVGFCTDTSVIGTEFYVILEGEAKVVGASGRVVNRLRPGEFFGEISLLDGGPRTATVVADTPLTMLALPRKAFLQTVEREPAVGVKLLGHAAALLRRMERSALR